MTRKQIDEIDRVADSSTIRQLCATARRALDLEEALKNGGGK